MITSLLIDLRPLRSSRAFRRLYLGSLASSLGSELTNFAVLYQVWTITGSAAATGLLAVLRVIPLFLLSPVGGSLADRHDRRRILLLTAVGQVTVVAALAIQAFLNDRLGLTQLIIIYVLVIGQGTLSALGRPAREAILPALVGHDQLAAARTLNTLSWQATALLGPAAAGMLISTLDVRVCYLIDLVSFCFGLVGILGLPQLIMPAGRQPHLRAMIDSLRLVVRHRPLLAALGLDAGLTVLAFPIGLLPALNSHLGGDPRTLGYLMSCLAVGGLAATLVSGRITRSRRPGSAMSVVAVFWSLAVIGLGLAPNVWAAMAFMIIWGAADILVGIPRGTLVQLATPDEHRGRVSAAGQIVGQGGPALGDLRGGLLGAALGVAPAMIIGGGCALLATAVISKLLPQARTFTVDTPSTPQSA